MHNYVTPDILNYHTYLYCRSIQLKLNCECDGQKMHFFPTLKISPETTSTRKNNVSNLLIGKSCSLNKWI